MSSSGSRACSAALTMRPHAVGHRLECEDEQLLLVVEVVRQRTGRPARLGRHAPHGHGVESISRCHLPDGGGERGAALSVVDDLRHRSVKSYIERLI